jgi:hypothetical protein
MSADYFTLHVHCYSRPGCQDVYILKIPVSSITDIQYIRHFHFLYPVVYNLDTWAIGGPNATDILSSLSH